MGVFYIECPYCEKESQIELEREEPITDYQMTCDHCNKKFSYYFEYDVNFFTSKLNAFDSIEQPNQDKLEGKD